MPSPSSLVLLSSRNRATMVTWRHSSPLYFGGTICSPRNNLDVNKLHKKAFPWNQWVRTPKLHIFETALQNGFFFGSDGFGEFVWTTETGGGGGESRVNTPHRIRVDANIKYSVSAYPDSCLRGLRMPVYMNSNRWRCLIVTITEATQPQRRRQRERQKRNKLRLAFLYIFLCRHCSTKTWNSLISPFMVDVNTRNRYSFCFCEL